MPEHELLMQLNRDMKSVCSALGRVEQKVDNLVSSELSHCAEFQELECRVTNLENKYIYMVGFAGGIALIVSWIMGWIQ